MKYLQRNTAGRRDSDASLQLLKLIELMRLSDRSRVHFLLHDTFHKKFTHSGNKSQSTTTNRYSCNFFFYL